MPERMLRQAEHWRDTAFVWKRFRPREWYHHRHCAFCSACICHDRDRDPYDKPGPVEGGHYRHAFYAEDPDGTNIWVCRSCFKRIQPLAGWTIRRSK